MGVSSLSSAGKSQVMSLNVLVVDDEQPARQEMSWLLEQCDCVAQVHEARSSDAALAHAEGADVVLLDINMPGIDGMRLAERWANGNHDGPFVIFVTAHDHHAVDAFGVGAVDYLLKPVRLERLQKALRRVVERIEGSARASAKPLTRISVQDRGVYKVLDLAEILYFESDEGIAVAETRQGRYITDFSLKFLEHNLARDRFFRSHRSTIVQLSAIESIVPWGAGTYRLIVDAETDRGVPLARSRAGELKSLIPWSANVFEE